jgi:hypothetical protein
MDVPLSARAGRGELSAQVEYLELGVVQEVRARSGGITSMILCFSLAGGWGCF